MASMCVWAALATVLLFTATVEAQGVEFWLEDFTMTCPKNGSWFNKQGKIPHVGQKEYTLKYDGKTKGVYHCEYKDDNEATVKYYFYVKGKVCERCFELDGLLFAGAVGADMVVTAFVIMMIYRYTKKKSSAGLTIYTPNAPTRSGGRPPPVPNPDYEQLNLSTRAQDPYSVVNRMG